MTRATRTGRRSRAVPHHHVAEIDSRNDPRRGVELYGGAEIERELGPISLRQGGGQDERAHLAAALKAKAPAAKSRQSRPRHGEDAKSISAMAHSDPEEANNPLPLKNELASQRARRLTVEVIVAKEADLSVDGRPSRKVKW